MGFSVRTLGGGLVAIIILVGLVLVSSFVVINRDVATIDSAWTEFDVGRAEKTGQITRLRAALGYDGMIHEFKNLVLRDDLTMAPLIRNDLGAARETLGQLSTLSDDEDELRAISVLQETLANYEDALARTEALVRDNSPTSEIDAAVRVNDAAALAALEFLTAQALPEHGNLTHDISLDKTAALEEFVAAIGYGGMIHNHKNFVLRGEAAYKDAALQQITDAKDILQAYPITAPEPGEVPQASQEEDAVAALVAMLDAYSSALAEADNLRIVGLTPEEIDLRVRVDDAPAVNAIAVLQRAAYQESVARSTAVADTISGVRKDIAFGLTLVVLLAGGVAILAVWVTSAWNRDKNEIERRSNEIEAANKRLSALVQHSIDGIIIIDDHGLIETFNPAAENIFGYSAVEIIGENIKHLMNPKDSAAHDGYLARYRQTGEAHILGTGLELEGRHKDGRRLPLEISISEMNLGDVTKFVGICRDISDREALDQQLRQAQKMEAIGQLTGGIAHDFNNILAIIVGNMDMLLLEEAAKAGKPRTLIDRVLKAAERGRDLVKHMLAFSRQQSLTPERLELTLTLNDVAHFVERAIEKNIRFETDIATDLPACIVDRAQLDSAILNMTLNARDAMPEGGDILIRAQAIAANVIPPLEGEDIKPGRYVAISVQDNGAGMSEEERQRVFEPFFTTKAVGKGTGLGLSIVYGFVTQSGGHVRIDSEQGEGTIITLYLPVAD